MNAYKFNEIMGFTIFLLGISFGLVITLSDQIRENIATIAIVGISIVSLVTLSLWKKFTPLDKKLKEFEV